MKRLSLIIPCYNESKSLPSLVERCTAAFTRPDCEVVLVDNGSTDETPIVLPPLLEGRPAIRSIRVEHNQGYGFGILSGLRACEGKFVGWTHADLQTDPADALTALDLLESSSNPETTYVKGRRFGRPLSDVAFTIGMSMFETALLGYPLWDINAQPNVFHRAFFERWEDPPSDFSLDLFSYYRARSEGLTMLRFPVEFGARMHGLSNWNVDWRGKYKFIKRTVEFSFALKRRMRLPLNELTKE